MNHMNFSTNFFKVNPHQGVHGILCLPRPCLYVLLVFSLGFACGNMSKVASEYVAISIISRQKRRNLPFVPNSLLYKLHIHSRSAYV